MHRLFAQLADIELASTVVTTRISGILLFGVFAVNLYLGLYDTNLRQFNPLHYDLNWLIAVVSLIAGILLLLRPKSKAWIMLGGVIWPLVYVVSLAVDVETKLCGGAPSSSCWPSHTAAFDYLVLNYASIPNAAGYGWKLAPVMPIAIALLFVVFVLSLISLYLQRGTSTAKSKSQPESPSQPPQKDKTPISQ